VMVMVMAMVKRTVARTKISQGTLEKPFPDMVNGTAPVYVLFLSATLFAYLVASMHTMN
jgi:hypothetical protein